MYTITHTLLVIDFGGATYEDAHKTTTINTRQYRGPEVTVIKCT